MIICTIHVAIGIDLSFYLSEFSLNRFNWPYTLFVLLLSELRYGASSIIFGDSPFANMINGFSFAFLFLLFRVFQEFLED